MKQSGSRVRKRAPVYYVAIIALVACVLVSIGVLAMRFGAAGSTNSNNGGTDATSRGWLRGFGGDGPNPLRITLGSGGDGGLQAVAASKQRPGQIADDVGANAASDSQQMLQHREGVNAPLLENNMQQRDYRCWEPVGGMSTPTITIMSEWSSKNQTIDTFIRNNKLMLAQRQGYRYCEISTQVDTGGRNFIWSRIPMLLAVLPCTEYIVHMDGDDIVLNPNIGFSKWIKEMNDGGLNMLMSADYMPVSEVNFGVFIVRNVPWVYRLLEQVYNLCLCDYKKNELWPREQGIVQEVVKLHQQDPAYKDVARTKIVTYEGWNDWWYRYHTGGKTDGLPITKDVFVMHYAGCCLVNGEFKMEAAVRYEQCIVDYNRLEGAEPIPSDEELAKAFTVQSNTCLNIAFKPLMNTAFVNSSNWMSSALSLVTYPESQLLSHIEVHNVACSYDMKCDLSLDRAALSQSNGCKNKQDGCTWWASIGMCDSSASFMIGTKEKPGDCVASCGRCDIFVPASA